MKFKQAYVVFLFICPVFSRYEKQAKQIKLKIYTNDYVYET